MILRRFIKHVSDQNWFAVGLDVLVVIVGIFVGTQVSEWNHARKAENARIVLLKQVYFEMAEFMDYWREGNEINLQASVDERFVLERLEAGSLPETDRERFGRGLAHMVSEGFIDTSLVVRRLETSDILSDLSGTRFEKVMIDLYKAWNQRVIEIVHENSMKALAKDYVLSKVLWQPQPYEPGDIHQGKLMFDFDTLAGDKRFLHSAAQLSNANHKTNSLVYRAFLRIEAATNALGEALGVSAREASQ